MSNVPTPAARQLAPTAPERHAAFSTWLAYVLLTTITMCQHEAHTKAEPELCGQFTLSIFSDRHNFYHWARIGQHCIIQLSPDYGYLNNWLLSQSHLDTAFHRYRARINKSPTP